MLRETRVKIGKALHLNFFNGRFTFNRDFVARMTRQSHHLYVPSVKLECSKKSFYYHSCILYNRHL